MTFEATQEEYRAVIERWLKNTTEEGDCRLWNGAVSKNNLPVAKFKGGTRSIRNVIARSKGMPKGYVAYCTCNEAKCIEPDHVKWMHQRKMSSVASRRRTSVSIQIMAAKVAKIKRERCGVLTDEQRHEILTSGTSIRKLAAKFGVNTKTVWNYRRRNTIKHSPWKGLVK